MQNTRLFTELNMDRHTHRFGHKALKWEHFMQCFKPAWDNGFNVERNLKEWRLEGMTPFNRNALWRKHSANAKPLSLLRASIGQSAIAVVIPSSIPAAGFLSLVASAKGPSSAVEDQSPGAASSLPPMPASVAETIHFVKRKDKISAASGPLSF